MEVIRLEAPRELHGGKELLSITFISPIREYTIYPCGVPGVHRGADGSQLRYNFWDPEMERELSFEVSFRSWRFSTKSPMLIRAMVNDRVNFEAHPGIKGGYKVDLTTLPWWAQEAWPEASADGRRAIVLKVMELQSEGKELKSEKYRLDLADELLTIEEKAKRLSGEGKTTEAQAVLDEARKCPNPHQFADCLIKKHALSTVCRTCHMHEMARKRKEALPDLESANQENIGPVEFEEAAETPA